MWRSLSRTRARPTWRIAGALVVLVLCGSIASATDTAGLGDAGPVLERYFQALKTGDVGTLESVLGGDLLARRRPLLENPTYPSELIAAYGNAQFGVVGWTWRQSKTMRVDVAVVLDANESVKWRLTMQRDNLTKAGLLIVDTTTLTK